MIFQNLTPEGVAYYACTKDGVCRDSNVYGYLRNYRWATDSDTTALKAVYYAVILHGWPNLVQPDGEAANLPENWDGDNYYKSRWSPDNLAEQLENGGAAPYLNVRPGILLLSCFTGHLFGKQLARIMNRFVLAPAGPCRVDSNGKIEVFAVGTVYNYGPGKEAPYPYSTTSLGEWRLFAPNGAQNTIPGAELDKRQAVNLLRSLAPAARQAALPKRAIGAA
jgi:hypothetical protein